MDPQILTFPLISPHLPSGAASGEGKKKSKDKKAAAPSPQPEDPVPEVPSAKQLLQPNGATNTASAKKTEAAAPVAKTAVKEVSHPSLFLCA